MANPGSNIACSMFAMWTSIVHFEMGWARVGPTGIARLAAVASLGESDAEEASQ
jgi:hypothetical protein